MHLFVIKSPSAGGAETYLLRFIRYCDDIDTLVLCKGSISGSLSNEYEQETSLLFVGSLGLFNPIPYFRLYKFLKHSNIDSICDFSGNFAGWVLFVAKLAGIPKRLAFYREVVNQFSPSCFKTFYAKVIKLVMYLNATKVLSNSEAALDNFHPGWKHKKEKFKVIYNGIDLSLISNETKSSIRKQLNIPEYSFVFCHSGRYTTAKNHDMIIKCAIELCKKHNDIHFVLIGYGVDDAYTSIIKQNNLSCQVHLLGYRKDVMQLLKCADCYYFPSLNEGQPNALIEAMVSGLSFVASDIAPIKEATPDFIHPYLINPNDYNANLNALQKAYQEDSYRDQIRCETWAKQHFEASKLFNDFKIELL